MTKKIKILFATNFSESSRMAMNNMKYLSEQLPVDFALIHVINSFWQDWLASGLYQKEAKQRLQTWQKELVGKQDDEKLFVELGNRADAIIGKAQTLNSDLIVLGSKVQDNSRRYKSSTTNESIVRHASRSVLISKNKTMDNILCAIDGSKASAKALEWAIRIARKFNSKLTILAVVSKISKLPLGISKEEIENKENQVEVDFKNQITEFLKAFDLTHINAEIEFKWGVPSHTILDTAEDENHDLIIIGATGHSLLRQVLIGSTAEKILRFAECSLLVVR